MKRLFVWAGGVGALALLAVAIGATRGPHIRVEDVWARPLPPVAESGELYMVIRNAGWASDRLVAGDSPACGTVVLYERYWTPQGAMSMRRTGPIDVNGGQRVELTVGGRHLMCMEKKAQFDQGVRLPLTLKFERSGTVHVQLIIADR